MDVSGWLPGDLFWSPRPSMVLKSGLGCTHHPGAGLWQPPKDRLKKMLNSSHWVCLKIVYPYSQWLMIIIPIKWLKLGVYPIFRHTHIGNPLKIGSWRTLRSSCSVPWNSFRSVVSCQHQTRFQQVPTLNPNHPG